MQHDVKSWPDYFEPIKSGKMPFTLRKDDRRYKVGDTLKIREFDDRTGKYTGRELIRSITFVLEGVGSGSITPLHGLMRGYSILGLAQAAD